MRSSSECIDDVEYDAGTLTIRFTDGTMYEYYNVPTLVWANLNRGISLGRYFNYNIRGPYSFSRLN